MNRRENFFVSKIVTYRELNSFLRVLASDAGFPVCCGVGKSSVELRVQPAVMCILCQEDEYISFDGNPMVCSAFVQK